jgi:hypothetical protein
MEFSSNGIGVVIIGVATDSTGVEICVGCAIVAVLEVVLVHPATIIVPIQLIRRKRIILFCIFLRLKFMTVKYCHLLFAILHHPILHLLLMKARLERDPVAIL